MNTFGGLLLLLAAGWLLVRRTGLARGDVLYDVSLGWFAGTGYFAMGVLIATSMQIPVGPLVLFAVIGLPFLMLLKGAGEDLRALCGSATHAYGILRGTAKSLLPGAPLILLAILALAVMSLQGASAPPVADDAVRVRLAEPVGQYFTQILPLDQCWIKTTCVNGIWPNYVPQLFWRVGGLNLFTMQYLVAFTVIFGLLLIFQSLVLDNHPRAAMYAAFMPTALPFFVFHGTISHLDIIVACFFGLGFFYFQMFTWEKNETSFHAALMFFTLTVLVKKSSDTPAFIGIAFLVAALFAHVPRGGRLSAIKTVLFALPLLIYALLKKTAPSFQLQTLLDPVPYLEESSGAILSWNASLAGIRYSLFSSGHFGILFYALGMSTVIFSRKIFLSHHRWALGLLLAVLGAMIAYYLIVFRGAQMMLQAQISRAMLTPAVAAALFLALLWGDETGQSPQ